MSQKFYLNFLKFGIISSLIVVFFVFKGLLFPFITSKQIPFNILVEILFIFWVAFIMKYPEYRPKKSYISWGLLAFFVAITITCFTGVDLNLSFWGDIERMLGVFHILHFFAFYLILISVMRTWNDWRIFFIASIVCAVGVSLKGLAGMHYSTIGNTAYVSGYLIFNIYFAVLLFLREKHDLKWLYLFSIPIMLLEFKKADTTGAYVGLGFSLLVVGFLYAILNKNKKIKKIAWSFVLIFILVFGFLFANRDEDFVKKNSILKPISQISFQKNTFQTRLISWKAAFQDFRHHPLLGVGFGNYALIFDKHFDPSFYDYTRSETYFDRAHNNLIDILSTSGILGLLSYLSIFVAIAYYMIKGYREDKINVHEFILITGLFVAYFVQNLAVFDSLVTYVALMMTLGYVYWVYHIENDSLWDKTKDETKKAWDYLTKDREYSSAETYSILIVGGIMITILFQFNIKPYSMLLGTIRGQQAFAQGNIRETYDIYRDTLSHNTVLDRDSRTSYIRSLLSSGERLNSMDAMTRKEVLDFAIEMAEKNVEYNREDSMNQMVLAQILNMTSGYYRDNQEEFAYYSNRSLDAINKSIEASPGRITIYYQKAQIYVTRGEKEKAIETLNYAVGLNEKYYDSQCYLVRVYGFYNDIGEEYYQNLDECVARGGAKLFTSVDFLKNAINHYINSGDMDRSLKLYARLSQLAPKDVEVWKKLASLYKQLGDMDKAMNAIEKAVELDPSLEAYVDRFLNE